MSYLNSSVQKSVYKIGKFLGVNENPDGDTNLKVGEAAKMRNFKITDGQALQKRPGSKNIAGLMSDYHYDFILGEAEVIHQELNASTFSLEAYPTCTLDTVGMPVLSGEAVTVTYDNWADYAGYYFMYNGNAWQLDNVVLGANKTISGQTLVNGGYIYGYGTQKSREQKEASSIFNTRYGTVRSVSVSNGGLVYEESAWYDGYPYFVTASGQLCKTTKTVEDEGYITYYGIPVYYYADLQYTWSAKKVGAEYQEEDSVVRALWSGYVGGKEYICAACNGKLWSLSEADGVWNKTEVGDIKTTDNVLLFAFGGKLYVIDGEEYKSWDGATFGVVDGYVPCLATASLPLEQLDTFAGDGETTEFTLSQKGISSIYKVFIVNMDYDTENDYTEEETTAYTVDLAKGVITMNEAPSTWEMIKVYWVGDTKGGGGTSYEEVNKLSNKRSQLFSGTGYSVSFNLLEDNILGVYKVEVDGKVVTNYTVDNAAGKVIFNVAPELGMNNVQIWWSVESSSRAEVLSKRYVEFFNGANDNRVFLYGDDNEAFYSGLDENGNATAEYFPDLNEMAIGETNVPITAMIRHYNRLLVFKPNGAYSVYYDTLTLEDGSVKAGFYVSPVNREIGNDAVGQARLVNNRVRTLDGRSIYEWKGSSSAGNITGDQRNANRISQPIENTLRQFDFKNTLCFYDKINHEYYAVYDGTAVVQNADNDAWYIYTNFHAIAMIVYKDEVYYGTADGWLVHFSNDYRSDNGEAIDAYWESGSLDFNMDYIRKYSLMMWVGLKPESKAALTVGADTEKEGLQTQKINVDVDVNAKPKMYRVKIKTSKFTYYKLIMSTNSAEETATVVSADIQVKNTSVVR